MTIERLEHSILETCCPGLVSELACWSHSFLDALNANPLLPSQLLSQIWPVPTCPNPQSFEPAHLSRLLPAILINCVIYLTGLGAEWVRHCNLLEILSFWAYWRGASNLLYHLYFHQWALTENRAHHSPSQHANVSIEGSCLFYGSGKEAWWAPGFQASGWTCKAPFNPNYAFLLSHSFRRFLATLASGC